MQQIGGWNFSSSSGSHSCSQKTMALNGFGPRGAATVALDCAAQHCIACLGEPTTPTRQETTSRKVTTSASEMRSEASSRQTGAAAAYDLHRAASAAAGLRELCAGPKVRNNSRLPILHIHFPALRRRREVNWTKHSARRSASTTTKRTFRQQ